MAGLIPFNKNKHFLRPSGFEEFYNMLDDFFNDSPFPRWRWAGDTFKIDVQENEKEYDNKKRDFIIKILRSLRLCFAAVI